MAVASSFRKRRIYISLVSGGSLLLAISALLCLQCCTIYHAKPLDESAVAQGLEPPAMESVRIQAREINHPILKPVEVDFTKGLTADQAAIVAVIQNLDLRAARDQKGIASAQLLQAGILPNPTFAYAMDFPTAGRTQGTVDGYGRTLEWDVTSLITRNARVDAARSNSASVDLDIAWKEWQVAQSAKQHVYRFAFLKKQLSLAKEDERKLHEHLDSVRKAVALGDMTRLDIEAAETAFQKVYASVLEIAKNLEQERLAVNSMLGFPPEYIVPLREEMALPSPETFPPLKEITDGLEARRLDLLALKMGYQSQEDKLRVAVLAQFPNISIGPTNLRDTSDIVTTGFTVSISLPVFDRNQGQIAIEKATREQLFDEYLSRLFEARAQVAGLLANMRAIEEQVDAEEKTAALLKKLVETSYNGFLEGNIDALSYYNELDRLLAKQLDVLKFKQDLADSAVALEIAAGEYLGQLEPKEGSK